VPYSCAEATPVRQSSKKRNEERCFMARVSIQIRQNTKCYQSCLICALSASVAKNKKATRLGGFLISCRLD
jgi:hypothetical protein